MPKISVITPIYKTEKYVAKCLDSVLAQIKENIALLTGKKLKIISIKENLRFEAEKVGMSVMSLYNFLKMRRSETMLAGGANG